MAYFVADAGGQIRGRIDHSSLHKRGGIIPDAMIFGVNAMHDTVPQLPHCPQFVGNSVAKRNVDIPLLLRIQKPPRAVEWGATAFMCQGGDTVAAKSGFLGVISHGTLDY